MIWNYKMIEHSEKMYIYAYSRESNKLDGCIKFDICEGKATIMKPSKEDENILKAHKKALEHFYTVVRETYPEERSICCG